MILRRERKGEPQCSFDPERIIEECAPLARHGRAAITRRDQAAVPDLPVMMVTAYGDDERRLRAAEYAQQIFL